MSTIATHDRAHEIADRISREFNEKLCAFLSQLPYRPAAEDFQKCYLVGLPGPAAA